MATRGYVIEIFTGRDNKTYFNKRSSNGKIAAPSQGYSTKSNAKRAAKKLFPGVKIVILDKET